MSHGASDGSLPRAGGNTDKATLERRRCLFLIWCFSFIVALGVTVLYWALYPPGHHGSIDGEHLNGGQVDAASAPFIDGYDHRVLAKESSGLKSYLESNLHPAPTAGQAFLQIALVLVLALLWFLGFLLGPSKAKTQGKQEIAPPPRGLDKVLATRALQWKLFVASLLPATVFVAAMYKAYQPAVFVMALVAIFVAAEHYGGLEENKEELEAAVKSLTGTLGSLQGTVGTILNADGVAKWRKDIYHRYLSARWRIDAVVRAFDIDDVFWELDAHDRDSLWSEYMKPNPQSPTLYHALTAIERHANTARKDVVQFVGCFEWPFRERLQSERDRERYFEKLLGLTWRLVVLELVREERGSNAYDIRVRMANAPAWMHAVDTSVFQVLEHKAFGTPSARDLTEEIADQTRIAPLSTWAHDDIRLNASRGCTGEEYVCSVLRYWAPAASLGEDAVLDEKNLRHLLNRLGMDDWARSNQPDTRGHRTPAVLEKRALLTFEQFLHQRKMAPGGLSPHSETHRRGQIAVRDLLQELL